MNNVIEVRDLCKSYEGFSLKNVSFDIPKGLITGFIGPNGSGKTTTIKSLLNMSNYESGQVRVLGVERTKENNEVNTKIGVVMDSAFFVPDWTITNVEKAVGLFYPQWDKARFSSYLRQFSIDRMKKVKELSRGMKVKLMLAVALSHQAKLLILDEPTSGLDPSARDEICELLGEFVLDEEHSVLFSTHITSDLEKIADHILFILDGEIVFSGPKEDLLQGFVCVKGGVDELNEEQKNRIIGWKEHSMGFEGMMKSEETVFLPKSLLVDPVTLDEIIVYMNREAKKNE